MIIKEINYNHVNKLLEVYRKNVQIYNEFGIALYNLLIHILENKNFKYQITYRIKSYDSLKNKIIKKIESGIDLSKLDDIHDIVGIRIIFYLESEKARFLAHLNKELTESKLLILERHKEKGYRSTHVIAEFGTKRLRLEEYKKFKGLKCEIQLTSALYHVWSEIEHDILYKQDEKLKKFEPELMNKLKEELEITMTDFISKASDNLERVSSIINELRDKHGL